MQFAKRLGWNKTSYLLMSSFALLIFLIGYIWWPLLDAYLSTYNPDYPFLLQFDWLLLAIFLAMSLLIMYRADLKKDIPIVIVGFAGGLVIESWGTQSNLWFYYTFERPPLWIIPAWPIASLAIDRIFVFLKQITSNLAEGWVKPIYWITFISFSTLMLFFIWPTLQQSLTIMAVFLCAFLILTPVNYRAMLLTFAAGSLLGYFLELERPDIAGRTTRCKPHRFLPFSRMVWQPWPFGELSSFFSFFCQN
jgi:hypothetical protein